MDARTFEPDEPLPRICKHCRWCEAFMEEVQVMLCREPKRLESCPPLFPWASIEPAGISTHPDHTCDHWEERK